MGERFTTFRFTTPLPMSARQADWPKCGRCAAGFYLRGHVGATLAPSLMVGGRDSAWAGTTESSSAASTQQPQQPERLMASLRELVLLRSQGCVSEAEFVAFKARLLASSP